MKTLTLDAHKRIRLGDQKPGQVFSRQDNPDGSIVLVPVVEVKRKEGPRFPKGSLLKYFTGEAGRKRNEDESLIASGCVQGPP